LVTDACHTSDRSIVTCWSKSGSLSTKTVAVITFVMLAIERLSWEFSSQTTSLVSGL
jgi:hypothetical protein